MKTEDLIKGAERIHLMNEVLRLCTVAELEYLYNLLPTIISKKRIKCDLGDRN